MTEITPVKVIPDRAKLKEKKQELVKLKLIPVPTKAEQKLISRVIKFIPFLLLERGRGAIDLLIKNVPLPSPLPFVLSWLGKGLGYAAKKYSVKQI